MIEKRNLSHFENKLLGSMRLIVLNWLGMIGPLFATLGHAVRRGSQIEKIFHLEKLFFGIYIAVMEKCRSYGIVLGT